MQEYKEEAIDKLTDLFNGDISGVTDRIDAMTNLAKEYKSFAGISDGVQQNLSSRQKVSTTSYFFITNVKKNKQTQGGSEMTSVLFNLIS